MRKSHLGAVVVIVVAFVLSRLLAEHIASWVGSLTGAARAGDYAVGAFIAAVPFFALGLYAYERAFRHHSERDRRWILTLCGIGYFFAGLTVGLLPYSRFGTSTNLMDHERTSAPGFIHAMDVTLAIGLVASLLLLLVVLGKGGAKKVSDEI